MRILFLVSVLVLGGSLVLSGPAHASGELTLPAIAPSAGTDNGFGIALPDLEQNDSLSTAYDAFAAWRDGDYTKARILAGQAGAEGNSGAKLLFGIMLDKGQGGPEDPVNAAIWYQDAATNGETDAWLALAGLAFAERGGLAVSDGRGFLLKAAKENSTEALLALGRAFASGYGGPLDEVRAENWFQKAIARGVNPARIALADLYLAQGKEKQALALYQTAVFGGSSEAAWKAGLLQADPDSAVYAPETAGKQLFIAAEAGEPKAMTAYGIFLASAKPALPAQAARWFRKAAEQNEPEGQYLYALSLAKGEGVLEDRELACEWALRASDNEPQNTEYRQLADVLAQALVPEIRERVYGRSKMPLLISVRKAALSPTSSEPSSLTE
jgi:TPR repeat protein